MSSLAKEPISEKNGSKRLDTAGRSDAARLLIVDDDLAITEAIAEFMARSGYVALTAATGEEALDQLETDDIDVVITDIMMPGIDGLELTGKISEEYDADVIVMTGYGGDYSYEEAVQKGASDFVFKPIRFEELLLRLKRVLRERRLSRERRDMLGKLKELAITDDLTKLYNSRHFYQQLELEADRANRYENPLALLLLDIDFFKQYNDSHGHLEGDRVLVRLGEVIRSLLRKMDSAYRYGGEEFTVILPETNAREALNVAQRIRRAVEQEKFVTAEGEKSQVTISIGVTEYQRNEDVKSFINRSDKAMYRSKIEGRNKVSLMVPESEEE
ncbi:MAG: diguanylate cyclase [Desulfobacterales bacterium]|nr:diguanylate cyclase [Desulfobacterales bacterium]MCF8078851.1 diguanylate cyclase [Desulfobacterales bacterium]